MEPGDSLFRFSMAGGDEYRVVGSLPDGDGDFVGLDFDVGADADDLSEQVTGAGGLPSVSEPTGEDAVEGACHKRDREVEVDLEGTAEDSAFLWKKSIASDYWRCREAAGSREDFTEIAQAALGRLGHRPAENIGGHPVSEPIDVVGDAF